MEKFDWNPYPLMANLKTSHGILALIDIVNFTAQSAKVGEKFTPQYLKYFQEKINSIARKNRFQVVKFMGDGALIFGTEPANLLDIMLDLFDRDKPGDRYGFISRFRIVAHSGYFQFQMEKQLPVDLMNAEGIKVFRMEKYAGPGELMVTHELYQGIKPLLTSQNVQARCMTLDKPLKGFDSEQWYPPFYKLTLIEKQAGAANLLEQRMEQLEQEVRFILVFGNLYDPVPMDKNFINLSILCSGDKETGFIGDEFPGYDRGPAKYAGRKRGIGKPDQDDWIFMDKMEREQRQDFKEIDVDTLYRNKHKRYTNGVIFGLPGAGKTTILRHLAHKEFNANRRRQPHRQKIILLVPCRDIPFYDSWHKDQYGEGEVNPDVNTALEYMTWVFLFGTRTDDVIAGEELVEFRNAAQKVKQAFKENRLTLLVDALDEAPAKESKERIKEAFLLLASKNRVFLTSRPSERIHLRQQKVPVFNVLSLTMEQVREVARHLMDENSFIYKNFDEALWKEEIVVKMAATPITALLVTAYFQAYGRFHHRFPMYDLLMKFILVKVWEHIKTESFPYKNLELFFEEVKKKEFFEKYLDAGVMYDGLGSLCYGLFFKGSGGKVHRLVNETTLKVHFKEVIADRFHYEENRLEDFVNQWLERFQQDHLLLRAGAGEYVFIHSTIMEYLAAFHMVQQARKDESQLPELVRPALAKEDFLRLETTAIAAGNDLLKGFAILSVLRDVEVEYPRELLFEPGIKCLAEVEWQITKMSQALRIESLKKNLRDIISRNRPACDWLYEHLKTVVLTPGKDLIEENLRRFDGFIRLSRDTLLEEYLEYREFNHGDSQLVDLRKQLLYRLVQKEVVDQWLAAHRQVILPGQPLEGIEAGIVPIDLDRVLQLDTKDYHPEDRNFKYYQQVIGKELVGFFGSPNMKHSGEVWGCAFSPDGKTFVSASEDGTLKLWDAETGKEMRTFTGHKAPINSCAFSPDGTRLVSASDDHTLKLWDAASGKEMRTLTGHKSYVRGCAFSPDGTRLVSASRDKTLKLWDVASGKDLRTFTGHKNYVLGCAFSLDGIRLVSASEDKTLKLWDAASGKELRTFTGHKDYVRSCAFSPDGMRLVSASDDQTLKLWDAASGKEIRTFTGHQDPVWGCAFSPDGTRLVSASSDQTLKLWNTASGKEIRTFTGHTSYVRGCAFSPDGTRLVSASSDQTLKLWDAASGKEMRTLTGHQAPVLGCAYSPDGTRLVSASSDQTLKLWDAASGKEMRTFTRHKFPVNSCAFSPDGTRLVSASSDQTLKLWDAASGKEMRTFTRHKAYVWGCAFSPDGTRLVSASYDKTLKLWDAASGKEMRTLTGHQAPVNCCAFSPDGTRLVSASDDQTLKLWDAASGKEMRTLTGHKDSVWGCAYSPDGTRLVSASADQTLKLWDAASGQCLKTLQLPWKPYFVAFSPRHPHLAVTANLNGTLTLFDFQEYIY
jgi:WD40 repeat protein